MDGEIAIKEAGGCEVDTWRAIKGRLFALAEFDDDGLFAFEPDEAELLPFPLVELEVPLDFVVEVEDELVDVPLPVLEMLELVPLPLFCTIG